ncbi:uncharacterized protein B0H64DRAFT_472943 [Chaetomium fimeti]|uniref:G-patch domain-containing protein n=1 Tax=Chaetomium fimeti TaxID=1854472 RepID=A0AAE0HIC1_9PEZI|nr:hypothetical protein B0H64DRAFT_472943 [Chaetomium fimeti]
MAAPPPQPPSRGGMSLYANLLDTDPSASIARDPVLFKNEQDNAPAKKAIDPALRFQPIRRPQVNKPSAKPKPAFPKAPPGIPSTTTAPPPPTTTTTTTSTAVAPPPPAAAPNRSTLADWAATEDDEYIYHGGGGGGGGPGGEKRQRGGRRKKKNKRDDAPRETDWDELYDPARPTNVEEYLRSEERVREVRDWKAVLYAHRRGRGERGGSEEGSERGEGRVGLGNQFAPPAAFTFAPPPMSPPRVADDATGDDAYARRLALSGMAPPPPPPPATVSPAPPPPPPPPTDTDNTTISRAPVRYSQPPNPEDTTAMDIDKDDTDYDPEVNYASIPLPPTTTTTQTQQIQQPPPSTNPEPQAEEERTTRPGQKGFAQRLMAKYGWTKGSGLGAAQSGIPTALRVQVEKRKRRPDAEGGGFVGPAGGRGRIIAPKVKNQNQSAAGVGGGGGGGGGGAGGDGGVGKMSVVVVLDRMLDGMGDVEGEVEAGLGQEIGEECGERYGRVERIVVDVEGGRVFIRFVEGVSALRAVNALQGRIFNGNAIAARFYDEEKFEEGVYDG